MTNKTALRNGKASGVGAHALAGMEGSGEAVGVGKLQMPADD